MKSLVSAVLMVIICAAPLMSQGQEETKKTIAEIIGKDKYIEFLEEENKKLRDQLDNLLEIFIKSQLKSPGMNTYQDNQDSTYLQAPHPFLKPDPFDYYIAMSQAWMMLENEMRLYYWMRNYMPFFRFR